MKALVDSLVIEKSVGHPFSYKVLIKDTKKTIIDP